MTHSYFLQQCKCLNQLIKNLLKSIKIFRKHGAIDCNLSDHKIYLLLYGNVLFCYNENTTFGIQKKTINHRVSAQSPELDSSDFSFKLSTVPFGSARLKVPWECRWFGVKTLCFTIDMGCISTYDGTREWFYETVEIRRTFIKVYNLRFLVGQQSAHIAFSLFYW